MENIQIDLKNQLEDALSKVGLSLRMDSKLCYCYVNGQTGPEWNIHRVVHECCVMHWLYNFTNYQERCSFASAHESRIHYFNSQMEFSKYMRRYVHPMIKETIIAENGGLPTAWPWIVPGPTEPTEPDVRNSVNVDKPVPDVKQEPIEE